jgi:hypothetical protein
MSDSSPIPEILTIVEHGIGFPFLSVRLQMNTVFSNRDYHL